jgi:hypothetical protein
MLTMFSIPKPFRGHIGMIQRNAITSWSLLQPRPEIILFGDEEGTAAVARELALRHMPKVRRNEHGTPLVSDIFAQAQSLASLDILCYVNADIILMADFMKAVQRLAAQRRGFLITGKRTELDVQAPIEFAPPQWETRMRALASQKGFLREDDGIDYFVFRRGLYADIPSFALGRFFWDSWLIWQPLSLKAPVVDASHVVLAIHQNHDYSHHPKGEAGIRSPSAGAGLLESEEALANKKMAGRGWDYTIEDATHSLTAKGMRPNFGHSFAPTRRRLAPYFRSSWNALLTWTGPIRHPLGLRRRSVAGLMARIGFTKSRSL